MNHEEGHVVSHKRHIAKAITWRIFSAIYTFIIGFMITGNTKISAEIVAVDIFTKIFLYYAHERIWYRFKYGVKS